MEVLISLESDGSSQLGVQEGTFWGANFSAKL